MIQQVSTYTYIHMYMREIPTICTWACNLLFVYRHSWHRELRCLYRFNMWYHISYIRIFTLDSFLTCEFLWMRKTIFLVFSQEISSRCVCKLLFVFSVSLRVNFFLGKAGLTILQCFHLNLQGKGAGVGVKTTGDDIRLLYVFLLIFLHNNSCELSDNSFFLLLINTLEHAQNSCFWVVCISECYFLINQER